MSKRQNLSPEPVDRISDLPDTLLCHILSFLPGTKEVVATSILSSRWTTLWTHVPYLDFEYLMKYLSDQDRMSFTHFVCRVLTLLKAPTLETFRLECEDDLDPLHVNTWICAALGRGVKELDLSSYGRSAIQLPRRVFTCESLVALKLRFPISHICPSYIHFPNLKILHLGVDDDDDSVDKIISGCPILEDLDIVRSIRDTASFNISIPTLKHLRVSISGANSGDKVQINTPSLDTLVIRDPYPADYLLNKLPKLFQADVDISEKQNNGENYGDCVLKLLRGLYDVKSLYFSYITSGINISFDGLPLFHNLVHLSLRVNSFDCHVLKTLLENSPNLKALDMNKTQRATYEGHESWSQPSRVPECVSSHLEIFNVMGFEGWEHELEFVKYILKNAQVLVTTTVYTRYVRGFEKDLDLIKKLSMFPRGSKTCQLAFN